MLNTTETSILNLDQLTRDTRTAESTHISKVTNPGLKGLRPNVKAKCDQPVWISQHASE